MYVGNLLINNMINYINVLKTTTVVGTVLSMDTTTAVVLLVMFLIILIGVFLLTLSYGKQREKKQDIEEKSQRLQYLANHDNTTGYCTRNHLVACLQEKLLDSDCEFAALFNIDVVNLKTINDAYGHDVGDRVLTHIASLIREIIVCEEECTGIYHTEFFVYDDSNDSLEAVRHTANKLIKRLGHTTIIDHMEIMIKVNVGVALAPMHAIEARLLMKKANIALVESGKYGPNRYRIFRDTLYKDVLKRITLEKQLRRGLINNEFEIYYQPRINMPEMVVKGCEALIRWNHPDGMLVYPDQFIPLAESVGFINEITRWVVQAVSTQVMVWEAMGHPLKVSFNISGKEFDDDFIRMLSKVLKDDHVNPYLLEVEITETAALKDIDHSKFLVDTLNALGVSVALDDFGTGYSSMTYIKKLKAGKLKIDRTFIEDIHEMEQRVVVESMIQLGQRLNYRINVEGVETMDQLKILKHMNVDEIQGWYFSKAVKADAMLAYSKDFSMSTIKAEAMAQL